MAAIAVSVKVAVVVSGEVGRSAVYSRYSNGPRTLPCGKEFCVLIFYLKEEVSAVQVGF
jgi:hypothetical protein